MPTIEGKGFYKRNAYDTVYDPELYIKGKRKSRIVILDDRLLPLKCVKCKKNIKIGDGNRTTIYPKEKIMLPFHYKCSFESVFERMLSNRYQKHEYVKIGLEKPKKVNKNVKKTYSRLSFDELFKWINNNSLKVKETNLGNGRTSWEVSRGGGAKGFLVRIITPSGTRYQWNTRSDYERSMSSKGTSLSKFKGSLHAFLL